MIKFIFVLCFSLSTSLIFAQNLEVVKNYKTFNIITFDDKFQIQIYDSLKFDVFNVKSTSFAFCELISYYNSTNTLLPKYLFIYFVNFKVSNDSMQNFKKNPLRSHSPISIPLAVFEVSTNKLYILNTKNKFIRRKFIKCK